MDAQYAIRNNSAATRVVLYLLHAYAGDVAMRAEEVTPVLKPSTSSTTGGRGPAPKLAAAFRVAVDQTGQARSATQ